MSDMFQKDFVPALDDENRCRGCRATFYDPHAPNCPYNYGPWHSDWDDDDTW